MAFEEFLTNHVTGGKAITAAQRHLLDAPKAKRVRPKFMLTCGRLLGVPDEELLESAVAVELMHTGSLIHDDLIDEADERRGRPSVNRLYGNTMALLAGDGLLSRAVLSLSGVKNGAEATREAAKTFIELTEAVAVEAELTLADATPEGVIRIADAKTGALFGLCGFLAGLAAEDLEAAVRLESAGRLAGRAFQIRDDIDDLTEDVANGVPTLPQLVSGKEAERIVRNALHDAITQLKPYADRSGYGTLIDDIYKLARIPSSHSVV